MKSFITITFEVPDKPQEEAIEALRAALESQPYTWTLDEVEHEPNTYVPPRRGPQYAA